MEESLNKICVEINKIDNGQAIENINKIKKLFLEKFNKIDKA